MIEEAKDETNRLRQVQQEFAQINTVTSVEEMTNITLKMQDVKINIEVSFADIMKREKEMQISGKSKFGK